MSYEDRCRALGQKGLVVWFTGLSGSGKSTIAVEVEKRLNEMGRVGYRLDGDNVRHGLNSDLGFSDENRYENIRRVVEVACLFRDAGIITLVSFISPFRKMRRYARTRIGGDQFIEVYVKAKIETCIDRDPKGLYRAAMAGKVKDFTGVSSPYEDPINPDVLLSTDTMEIADCSDIVIQRILASW